MKCSTQIHKATKHTHMTCTVCFWQYLAVLLLVKKRILPLTNGFFCTIDGLNAVFFFSFFKATLNIKVTLTLYKSLCEHWFWWIGSFFPFQMTICSQHLSNILTNKNYVDPILWGYNILFWKFQLIFLGYHMIKMHLL